MEAKEIKIVQDPRILQQIFKAIPDNGKNQINVVMVGQVNNYEQEFEFMSFLQNLPEPRMKNLKLRVMNLVRQFFKDENDAAKFLGISRRQFYLSYRNGERKNVETNDSG